MGTPLIYPKSFYFIRHGESEWNVQKKFSGGQMDTPLTCKGIEQAKAAIAVLDKLSPQPTHLFHSTLSRAADTAKILNHDGRYSMTPMNDLREIDAGEWQGISNIVAVSNWENGLTPKDGEGLDAFSARIQKAFNKILSDQNDTTPLIVAHGRILNGLDHLYGLPPRSLQAKNCQFLKFEPKDDEHYPWTIHAHDLMNGKIEKTRFF